MNAIQRSDKYVSLSNLSIYYTWKDIKSHIRTINLKCQLQHGTKNLNYFMNYILYQILRIILNIYLKNRGKTVNPSIRIYANKIENRITFKIKTGYHFKLLTPETIELLGSTKSRLNKNENG